MASCPSPMEGVTGPSHKPSGGGGCEFQKYFGHIESAIGFRFACVIRQWRTNANIGETDSVPMEEVPDISHMSTISLSPGVLDSIAVPRFTLV